MQIATDHAEPEYLLGADVDLAREQLEYLDLLLDHHTTAALDAVGVRPGDRCLEIGAGSGSIARRLADRALPGGQVIAVDLDPSRIASRRGLDVRQHDITRGVPMGAHFDLIHARLVLMHLNRRREVLADLVDALAPGGWLVVGEYSAPPFEPVSAPTPADAELYHQVVQTTIDQIGRPGGISYEWHAEVDGQFGRAGLVDVHSHRHTEAVAGGSTGALLLSNYIRQVDGPLRALGIPDEDLRRFHELMTDPRFRTWMFDFTYVSGRKPWN